MASASSVILVLWGILSIISIFAFLAVFVASIASFVLKNLREGFRKIVSIHTALMALIAFTSFFKVLFYGFSAGAALGRQSFMFWVFMFAFNYICQAGLLIILTIIVYIWFKELCRQKGVDSKPALLITFVLGGLFTLAGVILTLGWIIAAAATGQHYNQFQDLWQNKIVLLGIQTGFTAIGYTAAFIGITMIYWYTKSICLEKIGKKYEYGSIVMIIITLALAGQKWLHFFSYLFSGTFALFLEYVIDILVIICWLSFYLHVFLLFWYHDELPPLEVDQIIQSEGKPIEEDVTNTTD